ncbi:MAG: hypothetical protein DRZ79_05835 [Candidatus Cloacimonadota bacterium]|nr:MAG: hypothetical protein DRZ79_05835 [Candidatus Cloacimonadota bacterium]
MIDKIEQLVLSEFRLHPEATLVDYYKLFFQGTFGPAHLLQNKEKAFEYLKTEIERNTRFETHYWQNISYLSEFYRINLKIVKDKKISVEQLFSLFSESGNFASVLSVEDWKKEWAKILTVIQKLNLPLQNFPEDLEFIRHSFQKNNFVFHHSEIYRRKYHPHYRIIGKDQFEKLISLL